MGRNKRNKHKNNIVEYRKKDHSMYYLFIIKAGIVSCLFLPLLIVHSHLFAMQVGKTLVFRAIIEIIAFFYILLIIKKPEYRPKWGLFEISITLFIFIYFLTSLTGANFLRSFWGTAERMGGFFTLLHFWAYFFILTSVFKSKKEWKTIFGISVFVALLSSLYGLGQSVYFWRTVMPWIELKDAGIFEMTKRYVTEENFVMIDNYRPFGTIGNAGLFTAYILYNMFFGLYLSAEKTERSRNKTKNALLANPENQEILDTTPKTDNLHNKNLRFDPLSIILEVFIKALSSISSLFTFVILIIAGSRSSFLAILGGLIAFALVGVISSGKRKIQGFSMIIIIALVLGSGYVYQNKKEEWVNNNYILARLVNITLDSDESRTMTWESSWRGFLDVPVLGVGPENYNIVFNKYFNPLHFGGYGYVTWYDKAHNIFLDILTTMGVVGLASYMSIFAIIYWFLIKNRRRARENLPAFAIIASLPVAYFVQNMFWFDDFSTYLMLFMFFAFVSNFWNEELKFEYNAEKGRKIKDKILNIVRLRRISLGLRYRILDNKNIIIASFGIFLMLTAYYTNIKAWKFHDLTTIAVAAFTQNADDSFLWYREAMDNSTYLGRQELFKRFGNYVNVKYMLSEKESVKEIEIFRANMNYAIAEMEKAVAENQQDVQFYSLLGAIYNKYYSNFRTIDQLEENLEKVGGVDITKWKMRKVNEKHEYLFSVLEKAERTLEKAVELSPERETVYYEFGQTMVFKKDYERAIELFKKGVDLNPPVPVSHWYLGMAYLNAKEYVLADAEINEAIKLGYEYNTIKDLLNITPIYIELKDYQRLKEIYTQVSDLDPNNPEIYVSLALVYRELGDKATAIEMAKKAMSIDESFRIEGEKFIYELESGK